MSAPTVISVCGLSVTCRASVRGLKRVDQMFVLSMAAYNLVRIARLLSQPVGA